MAPSDGCDERLRQGKLWKYDCVSVETLPPRQRYSACVRLIVVYHNPERHVFSGMCSFVKCEIKRNVIVVDAPATVHAVESVAHVAVRMVAIDCHGGIEMTPICLVGAAWTSEIVLR
eukprot:SAG31_NODE_28177_length_414_cov_1.003175_1_plen_116_part_01